MHATNLRAFLAATRGPELLIKAYCGLIAIELVMKQEVALKDHDVCAALSKFLHGKQPVQWCHAALTSLIAQLRHDLGAIYVNGTDGLPRRAPVNSYPYIRYTRIDGDGWPIPVSQVEDLRDLVSSVERIRNFLKTHFSLPL